MALRKSSRLAALGIALALPVSALAAALTDKNSVTPRYVTKERIGFSGVGCNVSAKDTLDLLPGAFAVKLRSPKVGDREGDMRITAISVGRSAVTYTAVADSANVCTPGGPTPPSEQDWNESFKTDVGFALRVRTRYRLDHNYAQDKLVFRPKKISIWPQFSVRHIKWKSFGGRKAVGVGRMKFRKSEHCNPKKCPENNRRFRVTLSKPSFCGDLADGKVQYGSMSWRPLFRLGVIRPGGFYLSREADCSLSKNRPIPR
jgi:hypothetical protein